MQLLSFAFRIFFFLTLGFGTGRAAFLVDPTGGTPLWSSAVGADDAVRVGRMIGFPFTFFGEDPVTAIDVSTNGNLNFSADSDYSNETLKAPILRISPLWDDLELVAGSGDSIVEKTLAGRYYSVTWRVHERAEPTTRHAFQVILFGANMRVNGFDFQKDDIVFCHEEIGATFSKDIATVGLDSGDAEVIVPVPGATLLNGLLPHREAGLLPIGGFLLYRFDGTDSYTVTIVGNRAPRPRDDTWYTRNRNAFDLDVPANDTDPDLDPLTTIDVTAPGFGEVTINPTGTLHYVPGKDFRGFDNFTYRVRDPSGLVGTASVLVRPFAMGRGAFEGLLLDAPTEDDPAPVATPEGSGYLRLTLCADGTFSGLLIYAGVRQPLRGAFDEWGNFTTRFTRLVDDEPQTFTLTLRLDLLDATRPLTGTLSDGTLTSRLTAARPAIPTRAVFSPQGVYKILLQPDESAGPLGIGYGTLKVTSRGSVSVVGKLGDGRNLATAGSIKPDGTFTLYIHLRQARAARAGAVWGAVKFDDSNPMSDCTGALRWFMPDVGENIVGFDASPNLIGSRHTPIRGERVIALAEDRANASIDIGGGTYLEALTIDAANKVIVEQGGDEKLTLTINPDAASFRGAFVEEVTDPRPGFKTRRINGVFLKKLNMGGGLYLGPDGSAAVTIGPPVP